MYWTLDRKQLPDSVRDPPSGPLCISGTVVDSGVFAPVLTFQKLFEAEGVPVTDEEVRGPMGVHKRVRNQVIRIMDKLSSYPTQNESNEYS